MPKPPSRSLMIGHRHSRRSTKACQPGRRARSHQCAFLQIAAARLRLVLIESKCRSLYMSVTLVGAPVRYKTIGWWALKIVVAGLFIAAAGAKLAGVQQMVDEFNQIGLGQWFRYFTGVTEIMAGDSSAGSGDHCLCRRLPDARLRRRLDSASFCSARRRHSRDRPGSDPRPDRLERPPRELSFFRGRQTLNSRRDPLLWPRPSLCQTGNSPFSEEITELGDQLPVRSA